MRLIALVRWPDFLRGTAGVFAKAVSVSLTSFFDREVIRFGRLRWVFLKHFTFRSIDIDDCVSRMQFR